MPLHRARARRRLLRGVAIAVAVSAVAVSTTGVAVGAGRAPGRVGTLSIHSGDHSLALEFGTPADNGSPITGYVAACLHATTTITASSSIHPVIIDRLVNNVFYSCSVRAYNQYGAGPSSYVAPGMPGLDYVKRTYTYCSRGGTPQLLDLFRPWGDAIVPVVMFVHGGGWISGRRDLDATLLPALYTSRGYAIATVDYRLAPAVKPPDQVRDIACAVRYLRANAAQLGLNTARVGGIGRSAGGNLVSMLGVHPPPVVDGDQYPGQSSKLQAVVDEFGVVEFTPDQMAIIPQIRNIFGTNDQTIIDSYAPIKYQSSGDPPFLITHGTLDATVPIQESRDFHNVFRYVRVPATFIPIAHTGHSYIPADGNPSPSLTTVFSSEITFFNTTLRTYAADR